MPILYSKCPSFNGAAFLRTRKGAVSDILRCTFLASMGPRSTNAREAGTAGLLPATRFNGAAFIGTRKDDSTRSGHHGCFNGAAFL